MKILAGKRGPVCDPRQLQNFPASLIKTISSSLLKAFSLRMWHYAAVLALGEIFFKF